MESKEKSLLIVGAGSFSVEVEELARLLGYTNMAFVDDNKSNGCVGLMSDIPYLRSKFENAIVALGNNINRQKYTRILEECFYNIPYLIHPTAYISPDAKIGKGCIVRAKAVISRFVELEAGVIINVGGLVDHHCIIGEYSHILMGAVIRNGVHVPALSWVDSNQVVQ